MAGTCSPNDIAHLLSVCIKNHIPFYVYRFPDSDRIVCGIQKSPEVRSFTDLAELSDERGFVMVPFDSRGEYPSLFLEEDFLFEGECVPYEIVEWVESNRFEVVPDEGEIVESDREDYDFQIRLMLDDLQRGKVQKAILSRIHSHRGVDRSQAPQIFLTLAHRYAHAFVFLVHVPGRTTWLGATPETLLRSDANQITTMALAGTQGVNGMPLEKVVWGQKERTEQQLVSDYIASILDEIGGEEVEKQGPATFQAGNVLHLKTEFRIGHGFPRNRIPELISRLHPTPAVCGLPKEEAMDLIHALEPHDREYYAGYLGPICGMGECSLFVNLRSMKLMDDGIALYVGGGITPESDPRREWEETCLKAETLLDVIESIEK